ncbi:hypothetical protein ACFVAD_20540 [Sutcliffiella sp. NPDC057660]|uniref:hypothetical protein n=1 Tax=Sutcliffiella sp. NPDC057660 TaxID=3346199 RepID=UPI00369804DB
MSDFYKPFLEIKEEMKELYLRDKKEFVLATSFGKDSTMVLLLFWEMLNSLSPAERHKKVHVITSNTEVETPDMQKYLIQSIDCVNDAAAEQNLPIVAHIASPSLKDNYWVNVLAKGNPPVSPNSRFRWCSHKLKINAVDRIMQDLMAGSYFSLGEEYDLMLCLGVRVNESISRNNSITKNKIEGGGNFAKHSNYKNVLVYHPIKHLSGSQLWAYFDDYEYFPWGTSVEQLRHFYPEGIFECSIKTDGQGNSCGNGRSGCWTCTAVSEDKMLKDLVRKDSSLNPLLEFKEVLAQIRNDARFRMPIRRVELKRMNKRIIQQENLNNQLDLLGDGLLDHTDESAQDQIRLSEYETFDRAEDVQYNPGSLTIEARVLLLRKLLFIQEQTGYELIPLGIVQTIQDIWKEEGYSISDITPLDWKYDGPVIYDKEGALKEGETTNPYPQFWIHQDIEYGRDEFVDFIEKRVRETGKSYFFYADNHDMGEHEQYAWNVAYFLVCDKDIHSYEEAAETVSKWLYEPQKKEVMDWDMFANRYEEAGRVLLQDPNYDIGILERINKVLITLGREPFPVIKRFLPTERVEPIQLDLFKVS